MTGWLDCRGNIIFHPSTLPGITVESIPETRDLIPDAENASCKRSMHDQ